jgi:hypothetical protein
MPIATALLCSRRCPSAQPDARPRPSLPSQFPGDFRNNYIDFGWDTFSEATKLQKRAIELNNGRAAQMGILALMVHEKLNNDPYIINTLAGQPVAF